MPLIHNGDYEDITNGDGDDEDSTTTTITATLIVHFFIHSSNMATWQHE